MKNSPKSFLRWLHRKTEKLNELWDRQRNDPDVAEVACRAGGEIATQAGEVALRLGWSEIYAISVGFDGVPDVADVKTFLAECIRACHQALPKERWLTVDDCAVRLNVDTRTVYRMCEDGTLPHRRVGSGRGTIRIRPDDLAAFERKSIGKTEGRTTLAQLREI